MDYTGILETLKKYYSNLLIIQYNGKPKAVATIKALVELLYINMILMQIRDAFDWKTALQAPLEIIGRWVGVDKFYKGQLFDFQSWFSLIDWDSTPDNLQGGFSTFENFETLEGGFLEYNYIRPTQNQLSTEELRTVIGLKIIKNSISFTCKSIDDAIWEYFEGQVYTVWDLENRVLTYYYPADLRTVMLVALGKNVLPYPPTVSIKLQEIIQNG